jgi:hypothetical protein
MNLNTKVQYRSTHPTKVAEASSAENAKGTSVTSMPSTSTEGYVFVMVVMWIILYSMRRYSKALELRYSTDHKN